jgi:RNA-binding protein
MTRRPLSGNQRKFLRAEAHHLEPSVRVGKEGLTPGLLAAIDQALEAHELIKIRFVALKEDKAIAIPEIEGRTGSACVGVVGHVGIFYRQQPDPEKRRIHLPPARDES